MSLLLREFSLFCFDFKLDDRYFSNDSAIECRFVLPNVMLLSILLLDSLRFGLLFTFLRKTIKYFKPFLFLLFALRMHAKMGIFFIS